VTLTQEDLKFKVISGKLLNLAGANSLLLLQAQVEVPKDNLETNNSLI